MGEKTRVIAVGGPRGLAPGSQARRCAECGELAYFTKETFQRLAVEAPGEKAAFLCLGCVPDKDIEVLPFNAAQVAQIQAAGCDMTAEQINKVSQELLSKFVRRRR